MPDPYQVQLEEQIYPQLEEKSRNITNSVEELRHNVRRLKMLTKLSTMCLRSKINMCDQLLMNAKEHELMCISVENWYKQEQKKIEQAWKEEYEKEEEKYEKEEEEYEKSEEEDEESEEEDEESEEEDDESEEDDENEEDDESEEENDESEEENDESKEEDDESKEEYEESEEEDEESEEKYEKKDQQQQQQQQEAKQQSQKQQSQPPQWPHQLDINYAQNLMQRVTKEITLYREAMVDWNPPIFHNLPNASERSNNCPLVDWALKYSMSRLTMMLEMSESEKTPSFYDELKLHQMRVQNLDIDGIRSQCLMNRVIKELNHLEM
ncbi:glutamic acid-rich protein-like [Phymastichus coffea]|uniref:glutamic acid-rich protein-like n=1 Tax=Phymastichus coffea TaxID=108790 RepID=UPI00273B9D4F|nr:glutamic acid-rich protein-like [Phymastichus coffea]